MMKKLHNEELSPKIDINKNMDKWEGDISS